MMEFTFDEAPWEQELAALQPGDTMPALHFLALTEDVSEDALEDAFLTLEQKKITLDITQLPAIGADGAAALRLKQEANITELSQLLALESNDPLRLYVEELAAIPVAGDTALLAQQLLQGEPVEEQLVNLCLSRVVQIALEMTGRGVLLLDLIQEGSLGLWQGILQYAGGNFDVHCDWWIRQYMAKAAVIHCRNSGLGQKLRQGMEDYLDIDQRLLTELGRNPTLEEIAQQMHVSLEEATTIENMLSAARTMQRAHAQKAPETPEPEDEQAVEDTAYFQSRQRIMELLSALDAEDAQLLSLRFGLEGGVPLTPQQVGERVGLTADQVVAREGAALAKLRENQD